VTDELREFAFVEAFEKITAVIAEYRGLEHDNVRYLKG
jgi:hypothetical protein